MLYYLLGFALFLACIYLIFNYNSKTRRMLKLPGPKHYFFLGSTWAIMKPPESLFLWLRETAAKYNGIFGIDGMLMSAVCIYNPEDVEIITSNVKYHKKSWVYDFLQPWLQEGLLLSNGPKWHQRRKLLTTAFHFNVLKKYFSVIKANDKVLVEALRKRRGEPVNLNVIITEYTLNTICETAMGTKLSKDRSKTVTDYKNAIYGLGESVVKRFVRVWFYPDLIFNWSALGKQHKQCLTTVHNFTRDVIEKRKKDIKDDHDDNAEDNEHMKNKRNAMLDLLIMAQRNGLINDKGIQEEVDTFMFEGHDTTAAGLTFTLMLLALHQDVQNKVVDELNGIFGNDTREATIEDLAAMKYLDLCIKESLRLYPPVSLIMRQLSEPVTLSNYTLPANIFCVICIFDLHRNERIFKEPNNFYPERFLPENSVGRHSYAYIPFSAGSRNCIGQKFAIMEMKSVISTILRNFTVLPVTKESELCFTQDLILRTTNPIYVKFIEKGAQWLDPK